MKCTRNADGWGKRVKMDKKRTLTMVRVLQEMREQIN